MWPGLTGKEKAGQATTIHILLPPPPPTTRPRNKCPYLLMKSMAWDLSWSALCRSARTRISHTLSIIRLEHRASSHITFSLSRAYCAEFKQGIVTRHTNTHTEVVIKLSSFTCKFSPVSCANYFSLLNECLMNLSPNCVRKVVASLNAGLFPETYCRDQDSRRCEERELYLMLHGHHQNDQALSCTMAQAIWTFHLQQKAKSQSDSDHESQLLS